MVYCVVPPVLAAGVPAMVVPLKVSPADSLGLIVSVVFVGKAPVVVMGMGVMAVPTVNVGIVGRTPNVGGCMTVNLKDCVAGALPTPLPAESAMVTAVRLAEPAVGVPVKLPVPLPLSWKDAQAGRLTAFSIGSGKPVVVTVKDKGTPTAIVAAAALEKAGF